MPKSDTQFKPGKSGNPGGRPKGTMKDYLGRMFRGMSDEEKAKFIKVNKLSAKDQIEFGEGKAKQDVSVDGELEVNHIISIDE